MMSTKNKNLEKKSKGQWSHFVFSLTFLIFSSCSNHGPTSSSTNLNSDHLSVNIDDDLNIHKIIIDPTKVPPPSNTCLKKKIGVFIGPGLYQSFRSLAFLNLLEKESIGIDYLCGVEMGGVISALYGHGLKSQEIEWWYFKNEKELSALKPGTPAWNKFLLSKIKSTFKSTGNERRKIETCYPVYNNQIKRIEVFSGVDLEGVEKTLSASKGDKFFPDNSVAMMKIGQDDYLVVLKNYGEDIEDIADLQPFYQRWNKELTAVKNQFSLDVELYDSNQKVNLLQKVTSLDRKTMERIKVKIKELKKINKESNCL